MMWGTISDAALYCNASSVGDNRDIDERREFDEVIDSRDI